jgi:DNA-directed RNA polymerase specialized sigma subunit
MVGLTKDQKEKLVLDLYHNEGKTYSEIASQK